MTASELPRFALPGTWARVDLGSEALLKSTVKRAVAALVGPADAAAALRADMRRHFEIVAQRAQEDGAVEFYIARQIVPGVPLSGTLAVTTPEIDLVRLNQAGLPDLSSVLAVSVDEMSGATAKGKPIEGAEITAVRQTYRRNLAATDVSPELRILQADYWVAAARPARLAVMSFTTAFVELEPEMLSLFDAIVSSTRWPVGSASLAGASQ